VGDHGARHLSPLFPRRLIRRDGKGRYQLNLGEDDREVLRHFVPQFTSLLDDPSQPALRRLFPPAYADQAFSEQQEEYRRLMQEDLVERHRAELELVASTASAETLSEEELLAWSRALNSIRLVLGTLLDVSEDEEPDDHPASTEEALYRWLTYVLGEAIDALEGSL
jgi:Domain of unknown function (DUF2017)